MEIIGYYTQDSCVQGNPFESYYKQNLAITKYVVRDEDDRDGNIHFMSPPLPPFEIEQIQVIGTDNLNLSPDIASTIVNLFNGNGTRGYLGFEERNGDPGIQLDEFFLQRLEGRSEISQSVRELIVAYSMRLQEIARPLPEAEVRYHALKQLLGSFLHESELLSGRRMDVKKWVTNLEEVLSKAAYQTGGHILFLMRMLNVAIFCTHELETRTVLYAGLGADTQNNCRYNLVEPLLLTNFNTLVGVEYASMTFDGFQDATIRELKAVRDPLSDKYLSETLNFRFVAENRYEATFYYLGEKRTVQAYFNTDINSSAYPREDINIIFDDSHAMSQDTFNELVAGLEPKGILIGRGELYYECPSQSCGKIEPAYFPKNFYEVNSPDFYELTLAARQLMDPRITLSPQDCFTRSIIYQKK